MKDTLKIGGLLIIALAVILSLWIFTFSLISSPENLTDHISFAQLVIESAGLIALVIVIWEFSKAQRKPKLELLLSKEGISEGGFDPQQTFEDLGPNKGAHYFTFHLILENYGEAIARWVKIRLFIDEPEGNFEYGFVLVAKKREKYWDQKRHSNSSTREFDGHESFVIYPQNRDGNRGLGGYENLGSFQITMKTTDGSDLDSHELLLNYSIKADGMDEVIKFLTLHRIRD